MSLRLLPAAAFLRSLTLVSLLGCGPGRVNPQGAQNDLRWMLGYYLRHKQEAYRAKNGAYASNTANLLGRAGRLGSGGTNLTDIRVRIHHADERGWSASASHDAFPGEVCVMYIGQPPVLPAIPTGNGAVVAERPKGPGTVLCSDFAH